MAYSEELAEAIRGVLAGRPRVEEKRMFGGLTFMVDGHMCVGVVKDELMVRLSPEDGDAAVERPHARPMDMTGRPMKGFVLVGAEGVGGEDELRAWVEQAAEYVATLPPK